MSLEERKKYLAHCSRCSSCKWVPSIKSERFAHICPSAEYGEFHAYSASGMLINGYSLLAGTVPYSETLVDSIYTCTMCGGCDVGCKIYFSDLVEPLDSMYALRERLAADGKVPVKLQQLVDHLRKVGNRFGLPAARRGDWCQGLNLPSRGTDESAVLLHVGDAAFDATQWPALRHVVDRLKSAGVQVVVSGADEPDCGALAFEIGYQDVAATLANRTIDWLRASGVHQVITCSDAAFAAFRGIYPRLGLSLDGIKVQHISEWLAEHSEAITIDAAAEEVVTYHDSCHLGRLSDPYVPWKGTWEVHLNSLAVRTPAAETRLGTKGVYEAPRQVLAATGARIVEMERTRESTYCCGAGAGADVAKPEFAAYAAGRRLEEAMETGASTLVTSCGQCSRHLGRVAAEQGVSIRVVTLSEFVRERTQANGSATITDRTS